MNVYKHAACMKVVGTSSQCDLQSRNLCNLLNFIDELVNRRAYPRKIQKAMINSKFVITDTTGSFNPGRPRQYLT